MSKETPVITVLFATHDGETTLPQTLDSFCRLAAAPGTWKLVAIDNGSTDRTLAILESYRDRLPLTVIHTPEPGKNRALNLARVHLEGDFVLFCDDDVVVDPGWIDAYRRSVEAHPELDIFCGPIDPLWPYDPPDWMRRNVPVGLVYALTDCEMPEGPCSVKWAWGPNFGVRRGLLEAHLPLPENIGPRGKDYPMGSESFLYPLADAGHGTGFVLAGRVLHIIRPFQMEREWPLGRVYRYGRGVCRMDLNAGRRPRQLFGRPLWLLRDLLLVKIVAALSFDEDRRYQVEGKRRYLRGYLYEYRQAIAEPGAGTA
jgi:glycosyltransferase involved in cell wall biosynthesis